MVRDSLFQLLNYSRIESDVYAGIPKVGTQIQADGLHSMLAQKLPMQGNLTRSLSFSSLADAAPDFPNPACTSAELHIIGSPCGDIPETTDMRGRPSLPARTAGYQFNSEEEANEIFAVLASSLGYWWWAVASDGFNLKKWLLERFPLSLESVPVSARKELAGLGVNLRKELRKHYVFKDNKGRVGNDFLPDARISSRT